MRFETERLLLRELTMDDLDALHEILSDPETMRHYPAPFSREKSRQWIDWNLENYRTLGYGLWAVVLKATGRLIGDCGITLQKIGGKMEPEIGYHIHKDQTRKGYATEAARACRNYAFDTLGFPAVYSYMKYTNLASQGVAKKNGMRMLAEVPDDKNTFTRIFAITREEYEALPDRLGASRE